MTEESDRYLNPIEKQADDIIDQDTDWIEFARRFDANRFGYSDSYSEWHASTPFRPMFLAYLWATVEQQSLTGIPGRLKKKPELALAFGFDPADLPSESTFKPSRLQKRFGNLSSTVQRGAEGIRSVAAERGAPIGNRLTNPSGNDNDSGLSERQTDRLLRRSSREVLKELKHAVIPTMELPRPKGAIYEKEEVLVLAAIAAIIGIAANDAGKSLAALKNPNPTLSDPFYEDGPSGETLLESMKEMSVDDIAAVMNFALRKTYTRAKPRLQQLENEATSRFGIRSNVAIDITYVAYYGDERGLEWLQGAPENKEYRWCHKFATITIVGKNSHYVLGVCPLGSEEYAENDSYPGKPQTYYHGNVVRRLLSIADRYASIRTVFADRAFHATDVIHAIKQRNLNYVIPAKRDDRIERMCNRFHQRKRGNDNWGSEEHREKDTELFVMTDYGLRGPVKHSVSNTRVSTNVVLLPPDEDDETHESGSPQPFLTNFDVSDTIRLDRCSTRERIEEYNQRGAIERSYSSIKEASAYTTSKEFEVRWWHFGFACVLYNLWLLVDFLTQERIGVIETRKKPRVSLSRFLELLKQELITLI